MRVLDRLAMVNISPVVGMSVLGENPGTFDPEGSNDEIIRPSRSVKVNADTKGLSE
jgi:hypothetical protein